MTLLRVVGILSHHCAYLLGKLVSCDDKTQKTKRTKGSVHKGKVHCMGQELPPQSFRVGWSVQRGVHRRCPTPIGSNTWKHLWSGESGGKENTRNRKRSAYRARRRLTAGCACAASCSWGALRTYGRISRESPCIVLGNVQGQAHRSSRSSPPSKKMWCRRRPRSLHRALWNTREWVRRARAATRWLFFWQAKILYYVIQDFFCCEFVSDGVALTDREV